MGTRERRSLPTRERGLKLHLLCLALHWHGVAPYTGAWIEMKLEISMIIAEKVAPYTGAWIEIGTGDKSMPNSDGRSLHGSVD